MDFKDGAVSQIGAPLDGRVVAVHVAVGSRVKIGDPLVTIDCPEAAEIRAQVETARANLRESRAALDRQDRMALGSLWSALAVLAVAPLAMSGGVFGLYVTRIPLSVSAAVGFIALLGQVCLASLLVVSAVDERRRAGESIETALAEGAGSRFRAVLMTAMLAILGLMPAAVSTGVGSETQKPFSIVIISGLVTAVAVTLLVLPTVYRLLVRRVPMLATEEDA